jgi:5-methylcytosine-specific restriction endonuclease McrA
MKLLLSIIELDEQIKRFKKKHKKELQRPIIKIELKKLQSKYYRLKTKAKKTPGLISKAKEFEVKGDTNIELVLQKSLKKRMIKLAKELQPVELKETKGKTKSTDKVEDIKKALKEQLKKNEARAKLLEAQREELEQLKEQSRLAKERAETARKAVEASNEELRATVELNETLRKLEEVKIEIAQLRGRLADIELYSNRNFTPHQRSILYLNAGGKCQICGDPVSVTDFEADHIIPFSKGGLTTIENGQCLCRNCNRTKSNKG